MEHVLIFCIVLAFLLAVFTINNKESKIQDKQQSKMVEKFPDSELWQNGDLLKIDTCDYTRINLYPIFFDRILIKVVEDGVIAQTEYSFFKNFKEKDVEFYPTRLVETNKTYEVRKRV